MSTREAAIAHRRFGLGARPGDLKAIASDPRGFVTAQLALPAAARLDDPDLEPSHVVFAEAQRMQRQLKEIRDAAKGPGPAGGPQSAAGQQPTMTDQGTAAPSPGSATPAPAKPAAAMPENGLRPGQVRRDAMLDELQARVHRAISTERALVERLVYFWSNHFCVSAAKGPVRGLAGGYEREAIRPHVLGRFADMLMASAQHPAMLIYLDNQISIGPNSPAGRNRKRGLNENLARELLELHTLGVDGGYTQADVTNLARVLTGWTVGVIDQPQTVAGKFFFGPMRHEPGAWTILGKRYEDRGLQTGVEVLADLARHPATARHIARKLARHFLADDAPAALIGRLEAAFKTSDGDLAVVARTLVSSPEVWAAPPRKVVPPFDFAIAIARGLGFRPKAAEIHRVAAQLGQPTWTVPSPKGWPDDDDAWMGPSAVRERLRIAEFVARQVDKTADPRALAPELLGDAMSGETMQAIQRAESREQGFELLVMAPEFLRR
jgi:uncharacterized protein (DUF1800 family)